MTDLAGSPPQRSNALKAPLPLWASMGLWVGVAVSTAILGVAAFGLVFGDDQTFPGRQNLVVLLSINGAILAALGSLVGYRVVRRFTARRFGEPAPRLHLRFIAMFSLAAAAPAILMALFLGGMLTRGVEFWFGERVNTVVESAADTARALVLQQADEALNEIQLMAFDLSQDGPRDAFTTSPVQYAQYLRQQAIVRGFQAAYIVDGQGTVLARSDEDTLRRYTPPSVRLYELAREGNLGVSDIEQLVDSGNAMRALLELTAYEDAFLYITLDVDLSLLQRAQAALDDFRSAQASEGDTRLIFILVYLETALLILIGAIWLALSAATRVVRPVSNLVLAAERVRGGDLDARVSVRREDDEIGTLGRAFNRMTRQLRGQRRELLMSHAQSERRRAFTEAVLSGVSAGVLGLDDNDRITLVNRPACDFLGEQEDSLIGRSLADVSAELESVAMQARQRPGQLANAQIEITDNEESPVSLNVRAGLDPDAGLIITFDDVSSLVAAQRSAAWRDVARRIAHEIKNPLTPIQLSAERLQRRYRKQLPDDELSTFDKCIETIVRQVSDIGRMVDEFSSFARMPQPKIEPVEMFEMVQGVVFAQRVANPSIKFEFEPTSDKTIAECDERLAAQALTNIVKNAAESVATRVDRDGTKGESGLISVTIREEAGFAVIRIVDNGLGWPVPDKERLTEPYMTTREKGTGLGLAIVKRVMEDHRGALVLLDRPAAVGGAIVEMKFPLSSSIGTEVAATNENIRI